MVAAEQSEAALESLGLIKLIHLTTFGRGNLAKIFKVYYYGQQIELMFPKEADNELELGKVLLTKTGQELAPICVSRSVDGYFDFVYDRWATKSYVPKKETKN